MDQDLQFGKHPSGLTSYHVHRELEALRKGVSAQNAVAFQDTFTYNLYNNVTFL